MLIRSIAEQDYPQATETHNAQNEPHWHLSPEQMRRSDEVKWRSDPHYRRYVAEVAEEVIATGYLTSVWAGQNVAGRVWTGIVTREDVRNTGVDTRLLGHALTHAELSVQEVWSCVREDFIPMAGYLDGFTEQFRSYGGELDLSKFGEANSSSLLTRLETEGVTLKRYADLFHDPERDEKLLALHAVTEADAPYLEPVIPQRHPNIHDDMDQSSVFVAVRNGEYVGYVGLEASKRDHTALSFLGVLRPYRNRGIGTALGVRVAAFAQARGYSELDAGGGAKENVQMQRVLIKLGFELEPDWVTFSKTL